MFLMQKEYLFLVKKIAFLNVLESEYVCINPSPRLISKLQEREVFFFPLAIKSQRLALLINNYQF